MPETVAYCYDCGSPFETDSEWPDVCPDCEATGPNAEEISLGWEAQTGYDSIATIVRVYTQRPSGAYECCWPSCNVARKDPEALWRHIHTAHGDSSLPPENFDPGPWL